LAPLAVLLFVFANEGPVAILAVAALLGSLWGLISLRRLYGETNDPSLTE
ncbi:MAG: hypothetical protein QOJ27_18, partial [Sphingomonadales bacterium]|nr:hypothetical protein [Sphingomonadales bacterium]